MYSKETIEKAIREAVTDVTGITQLEKDTSLIGRELSIIPSNFLYIFDILEKRLQLSVYEIFMKNTFEVMTVKNLTNAIFELDKQA